MTGTLTTSVGTTSFPSLNINRRTSSFQPSSMVHVIGPHTVPKASLHAVIDEPTVESKKVKNRSLYGVLNVKQNATPSQIKSAYRSLAKQYHPDALYSKHSDDSDFVDICNAYATLSDPEARVLYDMKLSTGIKWQSGGLYSANSYEGYTGQRWETDQCW